MLKQLKPAVVHIINSAKYRFYQEKLTTADRKETIRVIYILMNYNAGTPLPSGASDQSLADDFVHFFNNKVKKIRLSPDKADFSDNTSPRQTWSNRYLNLDPLRFRHGKSLTRSYQ